MGRRTRPAEGASGARSGGPRRRHKQASFVSNLLSPGTHAGYGGHARASNHPEPDPAHEAALREPFLVREDDGFTLVDTTVARSGDALIEAAQEAGGSIRRIAVTHGHGDHVGSLDELRGRLDGNVQVAMPELDARIHAGENFVEDKLPGSWPELETKPDVLLEPGDRVGSLEVIEASGHTPGHVAFLDTRDRTLI